MNRITPVLGSPRIGRRMGAPGRLAVLFLLAAPGWPALGMTPAEAVAGMQRTWDRTPGYTCHMEVDSRRGARTLHQGFDFAFRKPRLARLHVTSGSDRGADVVYDAGGRVTGARRVLGIRVKKSMSVDDPKFRDLHGIPFWMADLGTEIEQIRRTMALPGAVVSAGADSLTVRYRSDGHAVDDAWTLDPHTFFPIHRLLTEDGVAVETVTVTGVSLEAKPEGYFHL